MADPNLQFDNSLGVGFNDGSGFDPSQYFPNTSLTNGGAVPYFGTGGTFDTSNNPGFNFGGGFGDPTVGFQYGSQDPSSNGGFDPGNFQGPPGGGSWFDFLSHLPSFNIGGGSGSGGSAGPGGGGGPGAGLTNGVSGLGGLGTAMLDYKLAGDMKNWAERAATLADPFASQRPFYQQQLLKSYQDPNAFLQNDPTFNFMKTQGLGALAHVDPNKFGLGAGSSDVDRMNYMQGLTSTYLPQARQQLMQDAGAMANPNAAANAYMTGMLAVPSLMQNAAYQGTAGANNLVNGGWQQLMNMFSGNNSSNNNQPNATEGLGAGGAQTFDPNNTEHVNNLVTFNNNTGQ